MRAIPPPFPAPTQRNRKIDTSIDGEWTEVDKKRGAEEWKILRWNTAARKLPALAGTVYTLVAVRTKDNGKPRPDSFPEIGSFCALFSLSY